MGCDLMPIAICSKCHKQVPDSFHNFKEYCTCKTKEEWIAYYKKKKWLLKINDEVYDFTEE